jgi:hypothetical protein
MLLKDLAGAVAVQSVVIHDQNRDDLGLHGPEGTRSFALRRCGNYPCRLGGTRCGIGAILGAAAFALAACGGSSGSGQSQSSNQPAAAAKTVHVTLVGKIDANSGPAGTFTGKEHWPAFAPNTIHVAKGSTVVLTIKEYDDAPTALPSGSPYNAVKGGTETVNGQPVTHVSNKDIAHTVTIPQLGINIPLPKAAEGGVSTIVFTFKANQAGDFTYMCMTPCGGGPSGMGGAMAKYGWMKGHLIVG